MNTFIFAIVVVGTMLYVAQLVIIFGMFIEDQFKTKEDFFKSFIPFGYIPMALKFITVALKFITEEMFECYKKLK